MTPGAGERGYAGERAHRHATAAMALQAIVDAQGDGLFGGNGACQLYYFCCRYAGDLSYTRGRILCQARAQLLETGCVFLDVVGIVQPFRYYYMHKSQAQRGVGTRFNGDMLVGSGGGAVAVRIDRDNARA